LLVAEEVVQLVPQEEQVEVEQVVLEKLLV
jgi:hypothetical protein